MTETPETPEIPEMPEMPTISVSVTEDTGDVVESFLLREAAAREWIGAVLAAEGQADELPAAEALESLCADGSVLCKLMECCFPKSVPKIHLAEQLADLPAPKRALREKENFMFFLEACQQCAHIPPGDLCSMQDLVSRDPAQVLATIEAVGEAAAATGYRGPLLPRVAESSVVRAARAKANVQKKKRRRKRRLLADEVVSLAPPSPSPSPTTARSEVAEESEAPGDKQPEEEAAILVVSPAESEDETSTEPEEAAEAESAGGETEEKEKEALEAAGEGSDASEEPEKENAGAESPSRNWRPQRQPEAGQLRKDMLSRKLRQSRLERKRSTHILGTPWDRQQSMVKLSVRLSAPINVEFKVTANQRVLAEPGVIRFQAIVRGRMARALYRKIRRNEAYRSNVAHEILATEQSYVENLKMLVTVFLEPLLESQTELSLQRIFGQVQVIIGYSQLLLGKVEERVKAWDHRQRLADVFVELANYLKVYTQYVKDYSVLAPQITAARKVPEFREAIKACEKRKEAKKMMLESLLIMPVQRIPRYQMLIEDLLKHTKEDHPDYKNLGDAAAKIKEVAIYVNERAEEFENLRKVLAIQHQFTGKAVLSLPHRRFVDESPILVGPRKELSKMFLFNDILIIGVFSDKQEAYRLRRKIPLERIGVEDIPDDDNHENCFWVLEEKHTPLLLGCLASKKGRLSKKRKAKWLAVIGKTKGLWLASQAEFSKVRESTERIVTKKEVGGRPRKHSDISKEDEAKFKEGLTKALDAPARAWGAGRMPSTLFTVLQEEMAKKREQEQRVMVDAERVGTMGEEERKKLIPLVAKADGDTAKFLALATSDQDVSAASVIITPAAAEEKRKSKLLKKASPRSSDGTSKKSKGLKGTIRRKTTTFTRAIPLFSGGKGGSQGGGGGGGGEAGAADADMVVDDTESNFERFMALVGTGRDPLSDPLMQRSPRSARHKAGTPATGGSSSMSDVRHQRPLSASVGGGSLGQASLDALLSPRDRPVPPPRPDRPQRTESDNNASGGRRLSLAPRSPGAAWTALVSPRFSKGPTGTSLPQVRRHGTTASQTVPDLSLSSQGLQTAVAEVRTRSPSTSPRPDRYGASKRATVSAAELRMAAAEANVEQPPRSPRASMRLTPNGSRKLPVVPPRSPRSLAGSPVPRPGGSPLHNGPTRGGMGGGKRPSPAAPPRTSPRRQQPPRVSPRDNRRSLVVAPTQAPPNNQPASPPATGQPSTQPPPRPPRSFNLRSSS